MAGWICLNIRRISLQESANEITKELCSWSKQRRQVGRHLSYEQASIHADKTEELNSAKREFDKAKKGRPSTKSDDYAEWQQEYNDAREKYEASKSDIGDYYDSLQEQIESEANDEETHIDDITAMLEAQLEAIKAELESVKSAAQSAAQETAPNFGN